MQKKKTHMKTIALQIFIPVLVSISYLMAPLE